MLAVADGRPETLSLKQIIEHHVDFQFEVCTRKHQTLLNKELEKKEITDEITEDTSDDEEPEEYEERTFSIPSYLRGQHFDPGE